MRSRKASAHRSSNPSAPNPDDQSGQAIVEYAIIFPIQLLLTLCIIQLALLFVATHVVNYAAFCAAEAERVRNPGRAEEAAWPQEAAYIALTRIAGPTGVAAPDTLHLPGWGDIPNYGAAKQKTTVNITLNSPVQPPPVSVEVIHKYELRVPIADWVTYGTTKYVLGQILPVAETDSSFGAPHIAIKGQCTLAKPWPD
jgi:Flp pilus assembly protein TadG